MSETNKNHGIELLNLLIQEYQKEKKITESIINRLDMDGAEIPATEFVRLALLTKVIKELTEIKELKDVKRKPSAIDYVTVEQLDLALRMCNIEISKTIIDKIIDLVQLIGEKKGEATTKDVINLQSQWKKSEASQPKK